MTHSIHTVQLFATCLIDKFFPDTGFAVVEILEAQGLTVTYPLDQTCCGQPAFNGGFTHDAAAMARHTIDLLSQSGAPVVVPAGSCAELLVHNYPTLLADDPIYAAKAADLARRTYEFSQFLVDVLGVTRLDCPASGRVAYHASCHGLRGLGVSRQPKQLLANAPYLEPVPLPDEETCCGFGGLFAVKMSSISGAILARKLDNLAASGADTVVSTDAGCLLHLAGGLRRRGSTIRAKHIADILRGDSS